MSLSESTPCRQRIGVTFDIIPILSKLSKSELADVEPGDLDGESTKPLLEKILGTGAAEALKLAVDSASDIFNTLGVDVRKTTSDRVLLEGARLLKRTNDSLLKFLVRRARAKSARVRIYVDEIHFAYRSEDSLQQDAMLVRDTILAVQSLNDRFAEEQLDIILYVAVRSEYLEHPIISTADINHAVESVGFELTYSNFPPTSSHPLFDLIYLRFHDAIGDNFNKENFFAIYLSGIESEQFLKRTWSKPRDMIRFFSCAKKLYPSRSSLSPAEQNTVWRNYSQEAWKEIKSAASPFLPPAAISRFEEALRGETPRLFDGSKQFDINSFSRILLPVYNIAKGSLSNFYDFDHFLRLLYILGIFSTRRRDAHDKEIFHSYHRGNRNFHLDGVVLIHPTVLKAFLIAYQAHPATAGRGKPRFRRPRDDVSQDPDVDSRPPASHRDRLRFVSAARMSLVRNQEGIWLSFQM